MWGLQMGMVSTMRYMGMGYIARLGGLIAESSGVAKRCEEDEEEAKVMPRPRLSHFFVPCVLMSGSTRDVPETRALWAFVWGLYRGCHSKTRTRLGGSLLWSFSDDDDDDDDDDEDDG